jgi:NAD(P)-dependent dehydrogenase (short-subunit alcohol dehydrogenase family)
MMQGKVVVVTGATNGIGLVAAREVAKMGAEVVVIGRSAEKIEQTCQQIRTAAGHERVQGEKADLSLMADVRALATRLQARYPRIDVLLNNAGGIFNDRQVTSEGLEMTFALNHMSYFLLTHLLMDTLVASAARIVNVSSDAHRSVTKMDFDNLQGERNYIGFAAYGRSKLMNVLFTYELARHLAQTKATANALHPGAVSTGFGTNNKGLLNQLLFRVFQAVTMPADKGALTSIYLASAPQMEGITGSYFVNSKAVQSSPASYDQEAQRRLWQLSESIAGIARVMA